MGDPKAQPSEACTKLSEFLSVVQRFSGSSAFKDAEAFINNFEQLTAKIKEQDKTMMAMGDELVRAKQELKLSNDRWETEHPKRIGEVFRAHQDEAHKIFKEKNDLQVELKSAKEDVSKQKSHAQGLKEQVTDLEIQLKEGRKQIEALQDETGSLKQEGSELKAELSRMKDLMRRRDSQIEERKLEIEKEKKAKSELEKHAADMKVRLQEQGTNIKRIQGFTLKPLDDNVSDLGRQLKDLWRACYVAVAQCFDNDIATSVLEDQQSWTALKSINHEVIPQDIPFPQSNEIPAKRIRTAAVMAVLADALTQCIFTPTYLLFNDTEFRNILLRLAETEAERGRFLRSVLNATSTDKQAAVRQDRIDNVVEQVLKCVRPLLDEATQESFGAHLVQLLADAIDIWKVVHRKRSYFDTDIDIGVSGWRWLAVSWTGQSKDLKEREIAPEHLGKTDVRLVLFPRVFIVTDAGEQPVFPGIVLPQSETRAAREELDRIRQSNPTLGRSLTNRTSRSRRGTTTQQNGSGQAFLGASKS